MLRVASARAAAAAARLGEARPQLAAATVQARCSAALPPRPRAAGLPECGKAGRGSASLTSPCADELRPPLGAAWEVDVPSVVGGLRYQFILESVQKRGEALKWAPEDLKGDRALVLAAVRQSGGALLYASAELRADREVVLEAVRNDPAARWFAADSLHKDPAIYPGNPIALEGAEAPSFAVWARAPAGLEGLGELALTARGGCGKVLQLSLPRDATLGQLGRVLAAEADTKLVHVVFPAGDDAGPLDVHKRVSDFL